MATPIAEAMVCEYMLRPVTDAKTSILIKLALLLFIALALCACDTSWNRDAAAKDVAEKYFDNFSANPDKELSLKNSAIFGHTPLFLFTIGDSEVTRFDANTRKISIPFWCSGETNNGEHVKQKRELQMVFNGPDSHKSYTLISQQLSDGEPLSFFSQFFHWLLWSSIAPFIAWWWFVTFITGDIYRARWILRFSGVPIAAYLAWVFFGSIRAVAGYAVVNLILTLIFMRLLTEMAEAIHAAR